MQLKSNDGYEPIWLFPYYEDHVVYYDALFKQAVEGYCYSSFHDTSYEQLQKYQIQWEKPDAYPLSINAFCDDMPGSKELYAGVWVRLGSNKQAKQRSARIRVAQEDPASTIQKQEAEGFDMLHISVWTMYEFAPSTNGLDRNPPVPKMYYNIIWCKSASIASYFFNRDRKETEDKIQAALQDPHVYMPVHLTALQLGQNDVTFSCVLLPAASMAPWKFIVTPDIDEDELRALYQERVIDGGMSMGRVISYRTKGNRRFRAIF